MRVVGGCQSSKQANGANDDMIAIKDIILNLLELSIEVEVPNGQQIDDNAEHVEDLEDRDEGKDRLVALLLLLPDLRASDCDDQSEDHGFEGGEGYGDCLRLGHVYREQHTIIIIVVNHSGELEQFKQRLPAFRMHFRLRDCLAVGLDENYYVFWRLVSVVLK